MNPELPNSPEDRLLDELLREQAHGPDEAFLQQIESAIDAGVPVAAKLPTRRNPARIALATVGGMAAAVSFFIYLQNRGAQNTIVTENENRLAVASSNQVKAQELDKAIRDQEDKVEERRKVLATIVRTKGIVYKGQDSLYGPSGVDEDAAGAPADHIASNEMREESIGRGLDAQDLVDAKRDFDSDQQQLEEMRSMSALAGGAKPGSGSGSGAGLGRGQDESNLQAANEQDFRAARPRVAAPPSAIAGKVAMKSPRRDEVAGRGFGLPGAEPSTGDKYGSFIDQPWKAPNTDPLSTFSIDVDTASYSNVRRMIREGREIPKDAVRIEEFINAFKYRYDAPKGDGPFAVGANIAVCPWAPDHQLVRISIKGREIGAAKRPASNLVFLIDVSGSMQSPDKLPLLRQSMETMVSQLDERDRVAIVVYAGSEGVALPSTRVDEGGRSSIMAALAKLGAGGSTNGGAGINRAYQIAMENKIDGGVNRVVLATDGDFNVGVTGQQSLVDLVKERAKGGVYLTVAGFGTGNLNDSMMDAITHDGNGNYFYIDSEREGQKVFLKNLSGTLVTIAKDVKIQVEFNPAKVGSYRLIGYANRVLHKEDFDNDKVDAGDIGAGHTVTAFYEIIPPGAAAVSDSLKYQSVAEKPAPASGEWLTVKLRHKHPDGDVSSKIEFPLTGDPLPIVSTSPDFQFATAAALLGMRLRGMEDVRNVSWDQVIALAKPGLADDVSEDRAEFVELVKKLAGHPQITPAPAEIAPGR